ncbi:zinc finger CCCH domain-containing protein 3-like [Camellia sinensis]|nr:zinc finger CCCH domain-containing protein 3-like [Camellia sinensis]
MPDNRQVQSNGGVSNSSPNNLEEAIRRFNIHPNGIQDSGATANSYPDRPGEPDCIYYLRTGLCGYGSNCKFNHPTSSSGQVQGGQYKGELPERVGQPDCGYYIKTGTCKYGSTCKYHHPRDRHGAAPVQMNILGLPLRQQEKPCPFYMKTGLCKFGIACKFNHPQPASAGTVFPIPGSAAYGSSGSTVVSSSGLHYVGGVSASSLPKTPYLSGPRAQGPQTYMPVVVSPSQGIAPAHVWNTYMGCMSHVSSTSYLGSDFVYNSKNQGESGSIGMVHMLPTSIPHLPERPDQPECRHYMSTGSCKYGFDCKYNHPRERIAQLATNSLGPLGLPLRPGQAVCSYYNLYGLCKYGPTCKFDHPMTGYPYNYGLSYLLCSIRPQVWKELRDSRRNEATVLDFLGELEAHQIAQQTETSPSKPSKVPDWVRKSESASNKNHNLDTENSSEHAGSPPHPTPISSELPHDHSD